LLSDPEIDNFPPITSGEENHSNNPYRSEIISGGLALRRPWVFFVSVTPSVGSSEELGDGLPHQTHWKHKDPLDNIIVNQKVRFNASVIRQILAGTLRPIKDFTACNLTGRIADDPMPACLLRSWSMRTSNGPDSRIKSLI
jgi:hypothetical protein